MKAPLLNRGYVAILLSAFLVGTYKADAQVVQIDTGTPGTPLYAVGPIYMSSTMYYRYSRFAYLYTQPELTAAGFAPGTVISKVGWMKSTPGATTQPASFRIYMKNSTTAVYGQADASWTELSSGATSVYNTQAQIIPATVSPVYIDFTLSTPFTYTGGSLEILTEWDISTASAPIATGSFEWVNTIVASRIYGKGNSSMPSTLSSTSNNTDISDRRPVIQFTLDNGTGVREELAARISVYPNPAEQFIVIRNESASPLERIAITDAVGKVVFTEQGAVQADQRINVGNLAPGPYIMEIGTSAGRIIKRFTVL